MNNLRMASCITLLFLLPLACGHGLMSTPNIRGTLSVNMHNPGAHEVDPNAPYDFYAHFPAGDKADAGGSGLRSQERAAAPEGWTPFEPTRSDFKWRAGVCGDTVTGNEHLRGGVFYHNGMIVEEYKQGGIVKVELNIIAHHNGFIELHVCDVDKCGGEISEDCFRQGHCTQLRRARNSKCDSGNDLSCGPIDPSYPGRWYLPCSNSNPEAFGRDDSILYQLPDNLSCDHCVMHFFWTSANSCNPPGVIEYFTGPYGPNWPACPGQAGAIGGYTAVQSPCGPARPAEEYYQCADIRINSQDATLRSNPRPTPMSAPEELDMDEPDDEGELSASRSLIKNVFLIGNSGGNVRRWRLRGKDKIDISKYDFITFECVTREPVDQVEFYIKRQLISTENQAPYFMNGNRNGEPSYWTEPILNRGFKIAVVAGGERKVFRVKLLK